MDRSSSCPTPPTEPVDPHRVAELLAEFWRSLAQLAPLLVAGEQLAAAALLSQLRSLVLECMVALNGARLPTRWDALNSYLGPSQRAALEKTLLVPAVESRVWIGQAVALVVIYRWYAPQLVQRHRLAYPQTLEDQTLAALRAQLPAWPAAIYTA